MFSNLKNIVEIHIYKLLGKNNTFSFAFSDCINLQKINISINYNIDYAIKDLSGMFYNCPSLTSFSLDNLYLNYHDSYHYQECTEGSNRVCQDKYQYYYNKINISYMFYNCKGLKSINMNSHSSRKISDMSYMFYNCNSLESVNLANFDIDNILNIDLSYMFYNCHKLTTITLTPTNTNYGVSNMRYMFYNCISLLSINLEKFMTGNVPNIDLSYMFYNCQKLTSVKFISQANNYEINDMKYMFYNCNSLITINLIQIITKSNIYIDLSYLFYNCDSLTTISFPSENTNFGVSDMNHMFYNCNSLVSINLGKFATSNEHDIDLSYMFYNCRNITSVIFNLGETKYCVSDMKYMFYECNSLVSIHLKNFITKNNLYIDLSYMFYNCRALTTIEFNSEPNNLGVNKMTYMFYNCLNLKQINLKSNIVNLGK